MAIVRFAAATVVATMALASARHCPESGVGPRRAGAAHRPESAPDCRLPRRAETESTGGDNAGRVRQMPPETLGVQRTIIRRNSHLSQRHFRASLLGEVNQPGQVGGHHWNRQPAQVTSSQAPESRERDVLARQRRRQPVQTATRVAADTGVDHPVRKAAFGQAALEQTDPTLVNRNAIGGA